MKKEDIEYLRMKTKDDKKLIIFKIKCKLAHVFLCVDQSYKDYYIVLTKPKNYLSMWKRTTYKIHKEHATAAQDQWLKDQNYSKIDEQMTKSVNNPVYLIEINSAHYVKEKRPIPFIKYEIQREAAALNIKDGISRSIWLLINEASYIPLLCYSLETAKLISKHSGIKNCSVLKYDDIYNSNTTDPLRPLKY